MAKRGREIEAPAGVLEALDELSSTLERTGDLKLRALDKVTALVDPNDDSYSVSKALAAGDAAFYICELLADPLAAPKAAVAVAAICRHAAPSLTRLTNGPLVGLDNTVERVSLNPCQSDFVDSGALAALVPMLLSRQEAARDAAAEAVSALCSFHHDGKLAYLEGLVQALQRGPQAEALAQVYELVDAAVDSMECASEAASRQLHLVLPALLGELRSTKRPSSLPALALLATLCEKQAAVAVELRQGGAVGMTAQHLLQGPQQTQDAAARALWLLCRGERQCLSAEAGQLGCEALPLALVLVQLLEAAEVQEARAREEESAGEEEGSDCYAAGGSGSAAAAAAAAAGAAEICHAEEASMLLKALAALHADVDALVDERELPTVRSGTQCCIS